MKTVFVGHFDPASLPPGGATSAAGNQVQRQIFKELGSLCGDANAVAYAMWPQPAWPHGKILARSRSEGAIEFVGYVNVPVLKHLVFSARLLARLVRARPVFCVQYNSYLFENAAAFLYRCLFGRTALVMILQDINVDPDARPLSKRWLLGISARLSIQFARAFDLLVPISEAIIEDFDLDPARCIVFQGGATDLVNSLPVDEGDCELNDLGVFAGALESYNGVESLVERWLAQGVDRPLHVFGHGSLSGYVRNAARQSNRIVFHGFQPESVVLEWQRKARWNFCLRYSIGLNQAYFFPSKLFNLMCSPGTVVVNDFLAIPPRLRSHLCIVRDDLSDLGERLHEATLVSDPERVNRRRRILAETQSWRACISRVVKFVGAETDE